MNKLGFTFMEVIIMVIVIGICFVLTLPNYYKSVQKQRELEGIIGVQSIYAAQKRYHLDNGVYLSASNTKSINKVLNLSLKNTAFSYSTNTQGVVAAKSKNNPACVMTLDENGNKDKRDFLAFSSGCFNKNKPR